MTKPATRGFIYAFRNPLFPQWIKIGKARRWEKRLHDFQTYTPEDFEPVATLKTRDMNAMESIVHKLLKLKQTAKKEFFCIDAATAINVFRLVANQSGEIAGLSLYSDGVVSSVFNSSGDMIPVRADDKLLGVMFKSVIQKRSSIYMTVKGGEYIVLKGSVLYPMTDSLRTSDVSSIASLRATRESIENDPTRSANGKLLVDVPFKSSSRALAVMLGYSSVQGPAYWVDEEGACLASYLQGK